ncbi:hypothetical protein CTI12_AA602780 [Artemisia annua]|uniref:Uncharacterized protein n=1 Tax=Artemisia annua TaxID=35608 RepID=A0A2U1KHZ0_ARTAN|nr:hypothetical protein CTI12_AA602780 [Artemisia annua]
MKTRSGSVGGRGVSGMPAGSRKMLCSRIFFDWRCPRQPRQGSAVIGRFMHEEATHRVMDSGSMEMRQKKYALMPDMSGRLCSTRPVRISSPPNKKLLVDNSFQKMFLCIKFLKVFFDSGCYFKASGRLKLGRSTMDAYTTSLNT